jgi:tetratricopeptide (TPR) repeat protein
MILFFCVISSRAEQSDSLRAIWENNSIADTVRLAALDQYIVEQFYSSDTLLPIAKAMQDFADMVGSRKFKVKAVLHQGQHFLNQDDLLEATKQYELAIELSDEFQYLKGKADALYRYGGALHSIDRIEKALDLNGQALALYKVLNNESGEARVLHAIARIYFRTGNDSMCLAYNNKSLRIKEKLNDSWGIGATLHNIGMIYERNGTYEKALEFFEKSLTYKKRFNNPLGTANTLTELGITYGKMGKFDTSQVYFEEALTLKESINEKGGAAHTKVAMGEMLIQKGEYAVAAELCSQALSTVTQLGQTMRQYISCECLHKAYKGLGLADSALVYVVKTIAFKDSLNLDVVAQKLQRMEFGNEMYRDSVVKANADAIEMQKLALAAEEKTRANRIQYSSILILVLLLGVFIAVSGKVRMRTNIAAALIFIFFILLFEFILVVMDPYVEEWSNGMVGIKLAVNSVFALVVFAGHQFLEKRLKSLIGGDSHD